MAEINEQQREFAVAYVANGGNGTAAAISAGYSENSARQQAYKLTRLPQVETAIRAEQRRLLGGKLANKALAVLEAILDDPKAPYGARVDAAKAVMDRGGLVAPKAGDADDGEGPDPKKMETWTEAELVAFISRYRDESPAKPGGDSLPTSEGSA